MILWYNENINKRKRSDYMKYKLIAADMDGTLLNSEGKISHKTCDAIKKAVDTGVVFTVSSGRPIQGILKYGEFLPLKFPEITYNGAMIVNPNNREILFHKPLEKDDALKILKLGEERSVTICLWCENRLFVNRIDERVNKYKRLSGVESILIDSKEALAEKGVTKILWYDEAEKIEIFQEALQNESFNEVTFCTSKPEFLEFFNSGVSKAAAMEFLGKLYGINREEMIAIGDGDNDLAMIEYAGLGISMENGSEKVKKAAGYITASNDQNGVALAIEKFILNHI